jgi:hypothetical protein
VPNPAPEAARKPISGLLPSGAESKIHEEQAEVVRRIFHMYVDGFGLAQIAKTLNEERVPAPQPPRTRVMQAWCPSSIREKLGK